MTHGGFLCRVSYHSPQPTLVLSQGREYLTCPTEVPVWEEVPDTPLTGVTSRSWWYATHRLSEYGTTPRTGGDDRRWFGSDQRWTRDDQVLREHSGCLERGEENLPPSHPQLRPPRPWSGRHRFGTETRSGTHWNRFGKLRRH